MIWRSKNQGKVARPKYLLMFLVFFGLLCISTNGFSQPPQGPPPPPDELFKKINPFKKHKKDSLSKNSVKKDTAKSAKQTQVNSAPPAGGPPPPPNPLNLFRKKNKKDTAKSSAPKS
jgi:hypothetical protein